MSVSLFNRLSLSLIICLILISALGSATRADAESPADTPLVFASETVDIQALALKDGTVFWGANLCIEGCGSETFVRSKPAGGGPIRTLAEDPYSDRRFVLGTNLAVDEAYVYWVDASSHVVKQRRAAAPGEVPAVVATLPTNHRAEVAVDGAYLYWLEGWADPQPSPSRNGRLVRMPKSGGVPLLDTIRSSSLWSLKVDSAGRIYYLQAVSPHNTLYRTLTLPLGGGFYRESVGTEGRVLTYTLNDTHVYWIERSTSGSDLWVRAAPLDNPSFAVTLQTLSGASNLSVAYLTVDANNLYWIVNYNDNSQEIVRMPLAGTTPTPVYSYGPGAFASDLLSNGRYLFWSSWKNVYRLPVTATLPDLTTQGVGLEVVQVIQGPANDVPLTQGKETFVRLYARLIPDSPNLTNVLVSPSATLFGLRNGALLPGSPLQPVNKTATITTQVVDRRNLNNSVLFRLPPDWTAGTITLQAILNPAHTAPESSHSNNTANATVTFEGVPSNCLYFVPVETTSGVIRWPDPTLDRFVDRTVSAWPVTHFVVGYDGGPAQRRPRIPLGVFGSDPYNLDSDEEMGYLLWNLWWSYLLDKGGVTCNGAGTIIVAPVPDAGRYGMEAMGVLFFLAPPGAIPEANTGGLSLAHELGHAYERSHVNCPPADPAFPDPFYPYPPCQIDDGGPDKHVGLDSLRYARWNPLFPPEITADYMSYSHGAQWSSDYTYRALIQQLRIPVSRAEVAGPATGDKLLIGGMLGEAPVIGFAVKVSAAQAAEIAAKLNAATLPSLDYQLRTYDAAGNLIAGIPLPVMDLQTESSTQLPLFFALVDDTTPAPARYEVRRMGGPVVLTRTAGPHAPSLNITAPTSGAAIGAQLDIAWSAFDPDGDSLLFMVRYSPDNGATWRVLGNQTSERALAAPTAGLHGGSQVLVEVTASDGVHSTTAVVGPFAMPRHAPQVAILDDAYRQVSTIFPAAALQSDVTDLRAQAYDAEDGMLSGAALQWQLTGPISRAATGDEFQLQGLLPGAYQVILTATDSDGASAQTNAVLTVSPKRIYDNTIAPSLDGYCDDPAYAADQDPVKVHYEDGVIAEARLVRADAALYACLAGLPRGSWTSSSAALQFDLNNSGDPFMMPDDLSFFLTEDGVAVTSVGDGQGGFNTDNISLGLTGAVSRSDISWNAEFRIDTTRLGPWNRLVRMRVGHYWRSHSGDDFAWPFNEGWNAPASWGLTALGDLAQTITFAALPDRLVSSPPFALSATTSSGLPPIYTAKGACAVTGNIVAMLGPGSCTITASQPGNASYAPALPVTRSFAIKMRVFLPVTSR